MPSRWREVPKKKYRPRDPKLTSAMMSAVKNRGGKAELALRRELWRRHLRYRLHDRKLIGRPDIVFRKLKTVVFVDGDFWHGRALIEEGEEGLLRGLRTSRSGWWLEKISRNVERDRKVITELTASGWLVLRYWESEIHENVGAVADEIESKLIEQRRVSNRP